MKNHLTFWNSSIIINLWNSKSEVIGCLHEQEGQKQKTPNQTTSKLGLMMKQQRGLINIAKPTRLRGPKQYGGEYTFFCAKNKNIGSLTELVGTDSEPI